MVAAVILPPVGIILGIVAIVMARKLPGRPGNKAVAISSVPVALMMILFLAPMVGGFVAYDVKREKAMEEKARMEEEYRAVKEEFARENAAFEEAVRAAEEAAERAKVEAEEAKRVLEEKERLKEAR